MIHSRPQAISWLVAASFIFGTLLLVSGCNRGGSAPQAMPAEQIASSVTQAFQAARGEPKAWSTEFVAAYQAKDVSRAFLLLQQLSTQTNLTTEQRMVVTRAMLTVNEQVQAAAAQGESKAGEVLQLYRSSK